MLFRRCVQPVETGLGEPVSHRAAPARSQLVP
jgi:hypothetical protein